MMWHVGFGNPRIGMFKLVYLALHIYGVCQFCACNKPKSNIRQGGLNLHSAIILDCQTKTAISCSEDCIAYKTCAERKKRR